jgi:hypothetical protein
MMPRFDLSKYATVAERLAALEKTYPDFRIETVDYSTDADRAKGVWRVRAKLYLTVEDQRNDCPKAIGHAFEVDGTPGANATSALENAETSAVGRCLALASTRWSGNKDDAAKSLASREEMEKVERGPQVTGDADMPAGFIDRVALTKTAEELFTLWDEAVTGGFSNRVKTLFADRKNELEGV